MTAINLILAGVLILWEVATTGGGNADALTLVVYFAIVIVVAGLVCWAACQFRRWGWSIWIPVYLSFLLLFNACSAFSPTGNQSHGDSDTPRCLPGVVVGSTPHSRDGCQFGTVDERRQAEAYEAYEASAASATYAPGWLADLVWYDGAAVAVSVAAGVESRRLTAGCKLDPDAYPNFFGLPVREWLRTGYTPNWQREVSPRLPPALDCVGHSPDMYRSVVLQGGCRTCTRSDNALVPSWLVELAWYDTCTRGGWRFVEQSWRPYDACTGRRRGEPEPEPEPTTPTPEPPRKLNCPGWSLSWPPPGGVESCTHWLDRDPECGYSASVFVSYVACNRARLEPDPPPPPVEPLDPDPVDPDPPVEPPPPEEPETTTCVEALDDLDNLLAAARAKLAVVERECRP